MATRTLAWVIVTGLAAVGLVAVDATPPAERAGTPVCPMFAHRGGFTLTQGVFTDDQFFPERPGAGLMPDGNDAFEYAQALQMVAGRYTTFAGTLADREHLETFAFTQGKVAAQIFMRMEVFVDGQQIVDQRSGPIKAEAVLPDAQGKCDAPLHPIEVDHPIGTAPTTTPFMMPDGVGGVARISLELADATPLPGVVIDLLFGIQRPVPLHLHIVPLDVPDLQNGEPDSDHASLVARASTLASELASRLTDIYPLPPGFVAASALGSPTLFPAGYSATIRLKCEERYGQGTTDAAFCIEQTVQKYMLTTLSRNPATLASPVDRTVFVIDAQDMRRVAGTTPLPLGFTAAGPSVVVRTDAPWTTTAHELAHTIPNFQWSHAEMQQECGLIIHGGVFFPDGQGGLVPAPFQNVVDGLQTQSAAGATWLRRPSGHHLMGLTPGGAGGPQPSDWISQCTYVHLQQGLPQLAGARAEARSHDGAVAYLVHGVIDDGAGTAEILPMLPLSGPADVPPPQGSEHALVVVDGQGGVLLSQVLGTHFGFITDSPQARDGPSPSISGFATVIEVPPEAEAVEVRRGAVVLDRRTFSENRPGLDILAPAVGSVVDEGRPLHVVVAAQDPDADPMDFFLSYSSDGGTSWAVVDAGPLVGPSLTVPAGLMVPGAVHQLRVDILDGDHVATMVRSIGSTSGPPPPLPEGHDCATPPPDGATIISPAINNGRFEVSELVRDGQGSLFPGKAKGTWEHLGFDQETLEDPAGGKVGVKSLRMEWKGKLAGLLGVPGRHWVMVSFPGDPGQLLTASDHVFLLDLCPVTEPFGAPKSEHKKGKTTWSSAWTPRGDGDAKTKGRFLVEAFGDAALTQLLDDARGRLRDGAVEAKLQDLPVAVPMWLRFSFDGDEGSRIDPHAQVFEVVLEPTPPSVFVRPPFSLDRVANVPTDAFFDTACQAPALAFPLPELEPTFDGDRFVIRLRTDPPRLQGGFEITDSGGASLDPPVAGDWKSRRGLTDIKVDLEGPLATDRRYALRVTTEADPDQLMTASTTTVILDLCEQTALLNEYTNGVAHWQFRRGRTTLTSELSTHYAYIEGSRDPVVYDIFAWDPIAEAPGALLDSVTGKVKGFEVVAKTKVMEPGGTYWVEASWAGDPDLHMAGAADAGLVVLEPAPLAPFVR